MELLHHSTIIAKHLLDWYYKNHRNLPWRETKDPYCIWVSEIILQQTRVDQGLDYYLRFIRQFPDVRSLAAASEQEVLKLWQGLGYYSRARHLHQTARLITEKHGDRFPDTYKALITLPGIGEYTAAAILSIAFGKPYPVVDGNVMRVIARLTGMNDPVDTTSGKKRITDVAAKLIPHDAPGTFNEAIMEFGALYCKPVGPDCEHCPVKSYCWAFRENNVDELPVRKTKLILFQRYFHYLVIRNREMPRRVILRKRTGKDIWMNMYDFPLIEASRFLSTAELSDLPEVSQMFRGSVPDLYQQEKPFKHILSHQLLHVQFFQVEIGNEEAMQLPDNCCWVPVELMLTFPVPRLITKYLETGW